VVKPQVRQAQFWDSLFGGKAGLFIQC
jgi:hypothetical protein